ncbi:unnamed protein product, partial [Cyprideis torosa]
EQSKGGPRLAQWGFYRDIRSKAASPIPSPCTAKPGPPPITATAILIEDAYRPFSSICCTLQSPCFILVPQFFIETRSLSRVSAEIQYVDLRRIMTTNTEAEKGHSALEFPAACGEVKLDDVIDSNDHQIIRSEDIERSSDDFVPTLEDSFETSVVQEQHEANGHKGTISKKRRPQKKSFPCGVYLPPPASKEIPDSHFMNWMEDLLSRLILLSQYGEGTVVPLGLLGDSREIVFSKLNGVKVTVHPDPLSELPGNDAFEKCSPITLYLGGFHDT